jgi:CHAD domain-containing protein
MAYRFDPQATVEENVHRILGEQLDKALHQLTDVFATDPAEAIHDARKRLKKARSLLRLVRKSMPKETYQSEKNSLRHVGHLLAPARDATVYQETLETLLEAYAQTLDEGAFAEMQQSLTELHQVRLQALVDRDEPMTTVMASLKESRASLQRLALEETGWVAIHKDLKRIYRQGQDRMQVAYDSGSDRAFHEWRKRVKDLWYDTRLLQSIWPPIMAAYKTETHQLSKYLGDDHDVAELKEFLLHHPETIHTQAVHLKVLRPLMGHFQAQLRQQARPLGQRLYAESPGAFCDRIQTYWQCTFGEQG